MLTLAMLVLTLWPQSPAALAEADERAMLELPAALGHMPKLRPPPDGLPMPRKIDGLAGTFLPDPLDRFIAQMSVVYWRLEGIGQEAIDASREADRNECSLRIDAAKVGAECPTCAWSAAKWAAIGGLAGIVVGGVVGVWVGR